MFLPGYAWRRSLGARAVRVPRGLWTENPAFARTRVAREQQLDPLIAQQLRVSQECDPLVAKEKLCRIRVDVRYRNPSALAIPHAARNQRVNGRIFVCLRLPGVMPPASQR